VSDTQAALDRAVTDFVEHTAHVIGAVVGSSDGHPLAARLDDVPTDAATVAAMGAATSGLTTQLIRVATDASVANSHVRGDGGQVWVLDVARSATLTVFAAEHADASAVAVAAQRTVERLVDILTTATDAP
jgi:predicted regulator of Ras-like GTPase activity (Roadblock/LC7/MglB family)